MKAFLLAILATLALTSLTPEVAVADETINYVCRLEWCYDEEQTDFYAFQFMVGLYSCPGSLCGLPEDTHITVETTVQDLTACKKYHYRSEFYVYPRSEWSAPGVPKIDLNGTTQHCSTTLYGCAKSNTR